MPVNLWKRILLAFSGSRFFWPSYGEDMKRFYQMFWVDENLKRMSFPNLQSTSKSIKPFRRYGLSKISLTRIGHILSWVVYSRSKGTYLKSGKNVWRYSYYLTNDLYQDAKKNLMTKWRMRKLFVFWHDSENYPVSHGSCHFLENHFMV